MPSWWTTKFLTVAQETNNKQHEEERECRKKENNSKASKKGPNKKKQKREKAIGFGETVLVSPNFPRTSRYLKASSIQADGASLFVGFHSDLVRERSEKEAYPLPRPSRSLELPSMKFDQKALEFASETASNLSCPSSGSYSSASLEVDGTDDRGDFGSFRVLEEVEWDFGLTISRHGLEAFRTEKLLPHPQAWQTGAKFQTVIKDETWRHLCHPLPLPPCHSNGPSQYPQSKWIKGRLLGRGSFGHVYAGFNCTNGQLCAIKEVKAISQDQNSEICFKQLNQEVAVLSQLSHPNIVQYYGSELGKGQLSLYIEYVSGGSIHKLLQEYGAFKEPLIHSCSRQILHALAYLHARNTVHRDIKGTNIFVDPNGEIKLADFGMAKHITSCTSVLSFKGSPHWMAPEVILNTSCFGLAVDIWSLGCTVIEMATSKPPWSQYEGVAALFKIANSKGYPQIPPHLSEDAQSFLKLCLQRDPALRPTAAQLLHHPFIQDYS